MVTALRVPAALAQSLSTVLATGAAPAQTAPVHLALLLSRRGLDAAVAASTLSPQRSGLATAYTIPYHHHHQLAPIAGLDGLDKLRDAAQRTWAR